ncbi:hypothetical protein, partial [Vibrio atlanticus]|uniref:hypothetical protein n=1 Tax=Vibrio atlanticus TaxID=693153 RepID=UPI00354CB98C
MYFYVFKSKSSLRDIDDYPAIVIKRDSWDDYSYKTTVELSYYSEKGEAGVTLGHTKITDDSGEYGYTDFGSDKFTELNENYCSLGQNIDFYKKIRSLGLRNILEKINDCSLSDAIRGKFSTIESYNVSLIRSNVAEKMLIEAKLLFSPQILKANDENKNFSFNYTTFLPNADEPIELKFNFKKHKILPYRINVVVGQNGTGKSQILSSLALDLSGMSRKRSTGEIGKADDESIFGNVNVISYSPFDSFKDISELNDGKVTKNNIKSGFLPYTFFGIRKIVNIKNQNEILLKSHEEIKSELKVG